MRAGLSTIQQTLTAEAASVLNHSIAEAARRNHGQTTPLHVAATLLASPTGFLRQACIKSHPNSSHPLQCRALELCFSVALERLPTSAAATSSSADPPISNALMAALKRAQAHQRRGCPEQQQQPLLAVKVELEQLIISILDDPSVSRVMREASFSSPAVKATIEQTLAGAPATPTAAPPSVGIGFRPGLYLNPRLGGGQTKGDEVKRVVEILSRGKKRNPVLVGDSEPDAVVREVLRRIEAGELGDGDALNRAEVIHLEKDLTEAVSAVEARIGNSGGAAVVLNLGDLKFLVEQPGQEAVAEVGKLLARFGGGDGRLWFIGTATCETYLRCQVYHPSMENDWDLQAVPIAARAPVPGLFPRLGTNGILSSSVESLSPLKGYAPAKLGLPRRPGLSENSDPSRTASCCPVCSHGYEQELAKHVSNEPETLVKPEGNRPPLPLWLQNAKSGDHQQQSTMGQEMALKQKTRELQKKWSDTCLQLHPSFHQPHNFGSDRMTPTPRTVSLPGLYNPALLARQPFQPKLQMNKSLGVTLQMNANSNSSPAPPVSPVRTELVLGQNGAEEQSRIKDLIGSISSEAPKVASKLDADSFKRLSKGLAEKVWWQPEAAVSVAATMTECRLDPSSGGRKRASKGGDMWVLFLGPDRVGKRKMASALADLVSGSSPAVISLGSRRGENKNENGNENDSTGVRGKTVVDKIVEAVRRNPFSVIVLEDVSEADAIVRASVKRAMERGRLGDSHGREVSLGNVVFVLTADWLPENLRSSKGEPVDEERLGRLAARPWQLRLAVKTLAKRRRFDLNEAAAADFDDFGSNNSSSIEHEDDFGPPAPPPREILAAVDDTIVFKPAETVALRDGIASTVSNRFATVVGEKGVALEMDEDALEKILSGLWLGKSSLEEFTETVLVPGFRQLKSSLSGDEPVIVRLESDGESERENWLPSSVRVVAP